MQVLEMKSQILNLNSNIENLNNDGDAYLIDIYVALALQIYLQKKY